MTQSFQWSRSKISSGNSTGSLTNISKKNSYGSLIKLIILHFIFLPLLFIYIIFFHCLLRLSRIIKTQFSFILIPTYSKVQPIKISFIFPITIAVGANEQLLIFSIVISRWQSQFFNRSYVRKPKERKKVTN